MTFPIVLHCLLTPPQLCAFKTSVSNSFFHGPRRNIFLLLGYWDQILKILRLNPKKNLKFCERTLAISQTFNENNLGKCVCVCVLFVQCVFPNKFSPLLQI